MTITPNWQIVEPFHYFRITTRFGGGLVAEVAITNAQFVLESAATNASTRFIYNQNNGNLFFDRDGTGALAANQIATLSTKPALAFSDILVIA